MKKIVVSVIFAYLALSCIFSVWYAFDAFPDEFVAHRNGLICVSAKYGDIVIFSPFTNENEFLLQVQFFDNGEIFISSETFGKSVDIDI